MLQRDDLDEVQTEVWDGLTESRGTSLDAPGGGLMGPFNAFVHAPKIGRRLSSLGGHLRFALSFERRLGEVAICTVGAHWKANFEFYAHGPMAIEHGVDPSVVDALRDGRTPDFERDDERTVHAVASQLLETKRVDAETYATAVELLGEQGMVELVSLVGYYCLISTILNTFEVPLPPGEDLIWPA